jgi:hypothetical protein
MTQKAAHGYTRMQPSDCLCEHWRETYDLHRHRFGAAKSRISVTMIRFNGRGDSDAIAGPTRRA